MKIKPHVDRVFITGRIPEAGLHMLQAQLEVEVYSGPLPMPRDQLLQAASGVPALLTLVGDRIDRTVIDCAAQLQIISNHAVGVDNIDVEYATRKGIVVTNTPAVLSEATADLTWALLLAVVRRVVEGDRFVRSGQFTAWDPLLLRGQDLVGKTLGLLGGGRIATAVARRAVGWKMPILYFSRTRKSFLEHQLGARRASLEALLAAADFVSIHLPLTPETRHLLTAAQFRQMKSSAFLINTARGAIVREADLVQALQEGWIAGAGLDVFEHEPQIHPTLLTLPNVVLTPHIGSATYSTRDAMASMAAENILRFRRGERPLSVVNPEVLDRYGIDEKRSTTGGD